MTVVDGLDAAGVLAGFGVTGPVRTGGPREAAALAGDRPVVRVVPVRDRVVAIEDASLEGVRTEVLARLSRTGRAVAVGVSGDGMRWLGYAADGSATRVETASAGAPGDSGWHTLVAMARHAAVPLDDWTPDDLPGSTLRFVAAAGGLPVDDDIVAAAGEIGVVLPVLPPVPAPAPVDGPAAQVAAGHVLSLLDASGVGGAVRAAVAAERPPPVTDESPLGRALRELLAGSPGPRADAGRAAHALLVGGPGAAVTTMLGRHLVPGLRAELGLPDPHRRATSFRVDTSRLRRREPEA